MKKSLLIVLMLIGCIPSITWSEEKNTAKVYKTESRIINDICFTPHKKVLAVADNRTVRVFHADSQELMAELKDGHRGRVLKMDISGDSTLLVSAGNDSTIVIWDFIQQQKLKALTFQNGIVTSLDLSPNGQYLVTGGTDKGCLYDIRQDKLIRELTDHRRMITDVVFSPDGKVFATAGADRTIYLYETEGGKLIATMKKHKNWVRDLAFSADGNWLLSCGDDSRIITWNTSDLSNVSAQKVLKRWVNWITSIDFYKDHQAYVYGDTKGKVVVKGRRFYYHTNVKVPVNKLLFKPGIGEFMVVVAATRGKGVMLLEVKDMKLDIF